MCKYFVFLLVVTALTNVTLETLQEDIDIGAYNGTSEKILSRKRRYLVFPEGSSLQLVYCLTIPTVGMPQVFTLGNTAALAWELPHDPTEPFRRPAELLHRSDTPVTTSGQGGWAVKKGDQSPSISYMKSYYNPFRLNKMPALGYSTIKSLSQRPGYNGIGQRGNSMGVSGAGSEFRHSPQVNRYKSRINERFNEPVVSYVDPVYHQVHRRTRRELYSKLQSLLSALNKDGKACLLKAICEVSQASQRKGTFVQEIIKAIFRIKPHDDYKDEDEYDMAANKKANCTEIYPTCAEHSVWTNLF